MSVYKVSNVLLEDSPRFYEMPSLFCKATAPMTPADGGAWLLGGPGTFDFSTFFNALSVRKLLRYTIAESFVLHLELSGAECEVELCYGDSYALNPQAIEGGRVTCAASTGWQAVDIPIEVDPSWVVIGFRLLAAGELQMRNAAYYAEVGAASVRPVELALATTTFKKEDYVIPNVRLVREQILESAEEIAGHFQMHVIDNGRTLRAEDVESPGIMLHPNPNVGGAGGFACGMLCAMEQQPRATHVLLMDDDVSVSPESIIRTFNLLRLLKDEYAETLVSGSMMEAEQPSRCYEDLAFWNRYGLCASVRPPMNVELFRSIVQRELIEPRPEVAGLEDQGQLYAAWWYCVIPLSVIEREGMPLPIFVRFDDAEYGQRCKLKVIAMNGICVWHDSFIYRYSAAQERYQAVRNALVIKATTGVGELTDYLGTCLDKLVRHDLALYSYGSAELALQALEDYLKGPETVFAPGFGEASFMRANRAQERLLPLAELAHEVAEEFGFDLSGITSVDVEQDVCWDDDAAARFFDTINGQVFSDAPEGQSRRDEGTAAEPVRGRRLLAGLQHLVGRSPSEKPSQTRQEGSGVAPHVTHQAERAVSSSAACTASCAWPRAIQRELPPALGSYDDGAKTWAVIDVRGWMGQFAKAYMRDSLIAVDPVKKAGIVRRRDPARCCELWARYQEDLKRIHEGGAELAGRYASMRGEVTSVEFWKRYLVESAEKTDGEA